MQRNTARQQIENKIYNDAFDLIEKLEKDLCEPISPGMLSDTYPWTAESPDPRSLNKSKLLEQIEILKHSLNSALTTTTDPVNELPIIAEFGVGTYCRVTRILISEREASYKAQHPDRFRHEVPKEAVEVKSETPAVAIHMPTTPKEIPSKQEVDSLLESLGEKEGLLETVLANIDKKHKRYADLAAQRDNLQILITNINLIAEQGKVYLPFYYSGKDFLPLVDKIPEVANLIRMRAVVKKAEDAAGKAATAAKAAATSASNAFVSEQNCELAVMNAERAKRKANAQAENEASLKEFQVKQQAEKSKIDDEIKAYQASKDAASHAALAAMKAQQAQAEQTPKKAYFDKPLVAPKVASPQTQLDAALNDPRNKKYDSGL